MDRVIKVFEVGAVVSDRQYLLGRDHHSSPRKRYRSHVDAVTVIGQWRGKNMILVHN